MHVVFWGTYDKGKPRVRILIRGLQENNIEISECHSDVWGDIEDKSQISGVFTRITRILYWLTRYPALIWKYMRLPKHDVVVIPYMGQLDVLVLWPFAKFRKEPIIWDAFLSLYNTVVEDRKLISRWNPLSGILFFWEWLACKAADIIILDTQAHADYFIDTFGVPAEKIHAVFVGAEPEYFPRSATKSVADENSITALFYGQFIPLHGIETIVQAASLSKNENINWVIIGKGQEENKIKRMLEAEPVDNLTWIPWVDYDELIDWIQEADICLGIFGNSDKASRVIPNKVFQIIMAGKPLITRDSPAIRELLDDNMPGVYLTKPGDPLDLVDKIKIAISGLNNSNGLHNDVRDQIKPKYIGAELINIIMIHTVR